MTALRSRLAYVTNCCWQRAQDSLTTCNSRNEEILTSPSTQCGVWLDHASQKRKRNSDTTTMTWHISEIERQQQTQEGKADAVEPNLRLPSMGLAQVPKDDATELSAFRRIKFSKKCSCCGCSFRRYLSWNKTTRCHVEGCNFTVDNYLDYDYHAWNHYFVSSLRGGRCLPLHGTRLSFCDRHIRES